MTRIALGIEYDGRAYHGWQSQLHDGVATVQETLEKALSRVADAPEFKRPIFVTYARDALDAGLLQLALDALGGVIEGNRQPR